MSTATASPVYKLRSVVGSKAFGHESRRVQGLVPLLYRHVPTGLLAFSLLALTLTPAVVGPFTVTVSLPLSSPYGEWYADLLSSPVQIASQLVLEASQTTTSALASNVKVTSDPSNLPQNEPSVTINPSSSSNLVAGANDYRLVASGHNAWAGVYTSFNRGLSWSNQLIPGFPGDTRTTVLTGFDAASDPALAFDKNGTLYYAGIAFRIQAGSATDGTVFVSRSKDGGVSFDQTVLVATGSHRIFNDKEYIGVDTTRGPFRGRIYVSWTMFTSTTGDIMITHSSDGGNTFSAPVKVSTSPVNQGSVPIIGPSGEVYVAWNDLSNDRIMIAKSVNGGVSFSSPVQVSVYTPLPSTLPNSRFRVNNNPAGAVDDTSGSVYVAWSDYRNGNADILLSRSISGGSAWSVPIKVNDDLTTNDQFFPWMAVSSGRLSIDFYDRRLDATNHLIDVFYAQSIDGGSTFSPNLRITDVSSNPDAVLFSGGQSFIGDYIGIASSSTSTYPVWTDLRNVAPGASSDQDIFTSPIASHDLAVKSVAPAKTVVYEGVSVNPLMLTASVQNQGISTETSIVVSFFSNGTLIGTAGISTLSLGASVNVTINWDTNALVKGKHLLSAEVSPVPAELNTANNRVTNGALSVRFPGDTDGDRDVDIIDIATLAFAFGSGPGGLTWNPNADVDNNGTVNIIDMSIAAANFGKIDP